MRARRRAREFVLYVVVGLLAAGGAAYLSSGLWRDSVPFDQLSWLGMDDGRVTGLDPETGQPKGQLQVGGPVDVMTVAQGPDVLIVTNTGTGEVTLVDLPTQGASQVRSGSPAEIKVLLAGDRVYLVNLAAGAIERIDPLNAATIGQPWRNDVGFIDAVADQAGRVWVLGKGRQLVALDWSEAGNGFRPQRQATVAGAGPRAVLVAHESGATVLDPDSGTAAQFGTSKDGSVKGGYLGTPLVAADFSPAGLVPFSAPDASTVLMVRDGRVVAVDTAELGCLRPDKPVVYRGMVYVFCQGARKVIVLDSSGRPGASIATPPGGDADLVIVGGRLFVNVPGADAAIMIRPDGSTSTTGTNDPSVDSRDARPTATATSAKDNRGRPGAGTPRSTPRSGGGAPSGTATPPTSGPPAATTAPAPTQPPPPPPDSPPTNVSAVELTNGNVRITWTPGSGAVTGYRVLNAGTGAVLASPAATAIAATIAGLTLGQPVSFYVEAITASGTFRSAVSNTVYPYREPREPVCRTCNIP